MISTELVGAANAFAILVLQTAAASLLVDAIKQAFKRRKGDLTDFYIDVCSKVFRSDWVSCTTEYIRDVIRETLSSKAATEEVAQLVTRGEFNFDRLEREFVKLGGDVETGKHLIETLLNSVAHQVFELTSSELLGFQIRIIVNQQQTKKNLEQLRLMLPAALRPSKAGPKSAHIKQSDNELVSRYLDLLQTSLHLKVNPFIRLLAAEEDDNLSQLTRSSIDSPVKMAVQELMISERYRGRATQRLLPVDLLRAVDSHDRAILLGAPGIGKTTTAEKLLYETARSWSDRGYSYLPLVLRCNEIYKVRHKPNAKTILNHILIQNYPLPLRLVESLLKIGRVLLVVDGLNELPRRQDRIYIQYLYAVEQFTKLYPRNKIVLTCREYEFVDVFAGFTKFFVQPLDPSQIEHLTLSLLTSKKKRAAFLKKLSESTAFVQNASKNPYYLTILLVLFNVTGRLPQDNASLSDLIVDVLLKRHLLNNPSFDVSSTKKELATIAWNMLQEGIAGSWVTINRLQESRRADLFQWVNMSSKDLTKAIDIGCSSGILKSDPFEIRIGFYHQLLQEQIASIHLHQILFDGHKWRTPESGSFLGGISRPSQGMGFDFESQFFSVMRNLASRLSKEQFGMFVSIVSKTNINLLSSIRDAVPDQVLAGMINHLAEEMAAPECPYSTFINDLWLIQSLRSEDSATALIDLAFKIYLTSDDRPEAVYILRQVNRALKNIEGG
jgi:hypothetical protein